MDATLEMFTTLSNATSYKFYSTIVGAQWGALSLLECEYGRNVDHCIEKLEGFFSNENVVGSWNNITMESKIGGCGFFGVSCVQVYLMEINIFSSSSLSIKGWCKTSSMEENEGNSTTSNASWRQFS